MNSRNKKYNAIERRPLNICICSDGISDIITEPYYDADIICLSLLVC